MKMSILPKAEFSNGYMRCGRMTGLAHLNSRENGSLRTPSHSLGLPLVACTSVISTLVAPRPTWKVSLRRFANPS